MTDNNVDWSSLSDDDFMNVLESVEANPPDEESSNNDKEPETEENIEDTDQNVDDDSEVETEGDDQEDNTESRVQEEENTQDTDSESDNQTEDGSDDQTATEQELDYKKEYQRILDEKQRYEDFYNKVTGEFVANGRKVKGFDDPEKIIRAQQMAAGYVDKMAAIKPYRPFLKTLKEKGILDNPEKFNFAMSLLDGDTEAIKKQLKESNIDPMEIDLDNINYQEKNQLPNNIELAFEDLIEDAKRNGVDNEVINVISSDWDDQSVVELLNDPESSSDLISHITSGAYDLVKERMRENKMTDVNGTYNSLPAIEQYRQAATELENEYVAYMQQKAEYDQYMAQMAQQGHVPQGDIEQPTQNQPEYVPPMQGQIDDAQRNQYMEQAAQKRSQVNETRRKAASLSKKKRKTNRTKKTVDPLELNDDQFTEYLDSIIYK